MLLRLVVGTLFPVVVLLAVAGVLKVFFGNITAIAALVAELLFPRGSSRTVPCSGKKYLPFAFASAGNFLLLAVGEPPPVPFLGERLLPPKLLGV